MLRSLFSMLVGVLLLAGSVQALPISDPPAVEPGGTTTAMADFTAIAAVPRFFDVWLNVPSEFILRSIFDDPSDGGFARYQPWIFQPSLGLETGSFNSADFDASGLLGIRVTDITGTGLGFAKIKLEFEALSTTAAGIYPIEYLYGQYPQLTLASFAIEVVDPTLIPLPGVGVLILAGFGAIIAVKRRRNA